MTDSELLAKATAFDVGPEAFVNGKVITPEVVKQLKKTGEYRRLCCEVKFTGSKWVITNGCYVLNKKGEMEYPSLPSNQEDEFKERTRFNTPRQAIAFFEKHRKLQLKIYDEIKDKLSGAALWTELEYQIFKHYEGATC